MRPTAGAAFTASLPAEEKWPAPRPSGWPAFCVSPASKKFSGGSMSEKIFAFLLRLYPARFRQRYQAEALELLHARFREERGLAPRLRLWMDLLADFVVGLRQAHRNSYPAA